MGLDRAIFDPNGDAKWVGEESRGFTPEVARLRT